MQLNVCVFSINLSCINVIIRPGKEPRRDEGKFCLPYILQVLTLLYGPELVMMTM